MSESDLRNLKTPAEYQSEFAMVFPSVSALRWFIRRHRRDIDAAGALVVVNRRILIDASRFDNVVFAVGRRSAQSSFSKYGDMGEGTDGGCDE